MRFLAAEVGDDAQFLVIGEACFQPRLRAHPGIDAIGADHQRGVEHPSVLQRQPRATVGDGQRQRPRRTQQGHVGLPFDAFPQFARDQAGFGDPRQFADTDVEGGKVEPRAAVAEHLDARHRLQTAAVQMCPSAHRIEEARTRRAHRIHPRVPATDRPLGHAPLDQRHRQLRAAQRRAQRKAGQAGAHHHHIEFKVPLHLCEPIQEKSTRDCPAAAPSLTSTGV